MVVVVEGGSTISCNVVGVYSCPVVWGGEGCLVVLVVVVLVKAVSEYQPS